MQKNIDEEVVIKFYKVVNSYGLFSNFALTPIESKGVIYPTVEHYYQSQKFEDAKDQQEIIDSPTPAEARRRGNDKTKNLRSDWEEIKVEVMFKGVLLKAFQHVNFRKMLLSTDNAMLVEDSPVDSFWGIGKNQNGKNMLGVVLMMVRYYLE